MNRNCVCVFRSSTITVYISIAAAAASIPQNVSLLAYRQLPHIRFSFGLSKQSGSKPFSCDMHSHTRILFEYFQILHEAQRVGFEREKKRNNNDKEVIFKLKDIPDIG